MPTWQLGIALTDDAEHAAFTSLWRSPARRSWSRLPNYLTKLSPYSPETRKCNNDMARAIDLFHHTAQHQDQRRNHSDLPQLMRLVEGRSKVVPRQRTGFVFAQTCRCN